MIPGDEGNLQIVGDDELGYMLAPHDEVGAVLEHLRSAARRGYQLIDGATPEQAQAALAKLQRIARSVVQGDEDDRDNLQIVGDDDVGYWLVPERDLETVSGLFDSIKKAVKKVGKVAKGAAKAAGNVVSSVARNKVFQIAMPVAAIAAHTTAKTLGGKPVFKGALGAAIDTGAGAVKLPGAQGLAAVKRIVGTASSVSASAQERLVAQNVIKRTQEQAKTNPEAKRAADAMASYAKELKAKAKPAPKLAPKKAAPKPAPKPAAKPVLRPPVKAVPRPAPAPAASSAASSAGERGYFITTKGKIQIGQFRKLSA